jgi:hypothetical protein
MLLDGRFQGLGLLPRGPQSGGRVLDARLYLVCASALGAEQEFRALADVNFYDDAETLETLSRSEESGVAVMNGGCAGMSPKFDSCGAPALASLVARAQIMTILSKARDGGSSWT